MISINGGDNNIDYKFNNFYMKWVSELSDLSVLEWIRDKYGIDYDDYDINHEYWFIQDEDFCEIYYSNSFGIQYLFIIIDKINKFNHSYKEINNTILIYKKNIVRDLIISKII